jgi:hypothetical protein
MISSSPGAPAASQVLARALRVERQDDVGRVALKRGRHDPAGRDLEVRRHQRLERGAVDRMREREPQSRGSRAPRPSGGTEVRDPRQRALSAILAAHVVRGARRVHDAAEVELAALERPGCLVRGGARDLDAGDVARMRARVRLVAHEDEPRVAVLELAERAADDLALGIRPVVPVALDRVLWKGPESGRLTTLMKYGAGATSLNSTVRSSSARTPIASASSLWPRKYSSPLSSTK